MSPTHIIGTVYVDNMRHEATINGLTRKWSHLFADSSDELIAFALRLGLNPQWIQHEGTHREHFDVTDSMRNAAIQLGATPITYPHETGALTNTKRTTLDRRAP